MPPKAQPKPRSLKQTVTLPCSPAEAYELLMSSRKHAAFTDHPAKISTKLGGKVSAYDGYIEACNLELKPGKKIVQAWRTREWPAGWFSKATWTFAKAKGGTKLVFTQTQIPAFDYADLKAGWVEHYWDRMKAYLAGS